MQVLIHYYSLNEAKKDVVFNKKFYKLLSKFGYMSSKKKLDKIKILKNFQRRFRPQIISSIVDKESYEILKSLI